MLDDLLPSLADPAVMTVLATAFVAGAVRGFAGFGAGMIFMPVASAVIDPRIAAAAFLLMDDILTTPLLFRAVRLCDWRTVLPTAAAAMATVPIGARVLATGDTIALRWGISILVLVLLLLLMSRLRYHGRPTHAASVGVGMTAGFLGGISQVSGPPVVAYWMSGPSSAATVRANLIVFFALISLGTIAVYWWHGFFTLEVLRTLIVIMPANALAIFLGARMFTLATDRTFRRVAYALVALAAIGSLPALDGILR